MALVENKIPEKNVLLTGTRLNRQLADYTWCINNLIWQRQAIFFAATILTATYYQAHWAMLCYGVVLLTEVIDLSLARRLEQ